MNLLIAAAFFATAFLYAIVGFGGGSTYTALLVLHGVNYTILPLVSLSCNIMVVTGGTLRFAMAGHLRLKRLWPFLALSIPAAWLGGRLPVAETTFILILGCALLASGLHLLLQNDDRQTKIIDVGYPAGLIVGGSLGFLSGIVGIGGGIFLAPVLYRLRWGTSHEIAAATSLYILLNAVSGILGQATKLSGSAALANALEFWSLLVVVLIGGQIGSWLATSKLSPRPIRTLTAILILYVSGRLLWQAFVS